MQEPQKIQFPEFEFQSKDSLKKCKTFNSRLAKIYKSRDGYQTIVEAPMTVDGTSYEQSFAKQEANGNFIDSHLDEKTLLESTSDLIESLISESVKLVKDCEKNSDVAFQRIKAEIEKYDLPFNNENQLTFFIRHCGEVRRFDEKVESARQFETASRQLIHAVRSRCKWLEEFVIAERSKLSMVA